MKRSIVCLFGILVLGACSENGVPDTKGPDESKTGGRFLTVGIADAGTTRAGADGYEAGSGSESRIGSLRFYFFDSKGSPVSVNLAGRKNYVDCTDIVPETGSSMPNVEKTFRTTVMVNPGFSQVGALAAIANYEAAGLGTESLSLAELCAKVGDYAAAANGTGSDSTPGFVMTSSSYAGADGPVCTAAVLPENLCDTEAEAAARPVTVYLERVVAKARLTTAWNTDKVSVVNGVTFNGKTHTAVALKDAEGKPLTVGGKQVYALFTGWSITGRADKSYLFKKINTETAWQLGWTWNNPVFFRSYWAANPAGVSLGHIAYNEIDSAIDGNSTVYCAENAADNFADGTKKRYDPDSEVGNRTQAIVAAVLVTVDGSSASPVDLARWAGADYTQEGVKTAMLNTVASLIYTKKDTGFVAIGPEHVKLVTATQAGMADDKSENSPRYLCYLQLTDAARALPFYSAASDQAAITPDAVDNILREMPGARVWKSGTTYYYTDIRHSGLDEQRGLCGVVRNHVYEISINSVAGLGTPVWDPDEKIVPQKPDDSQTHIAATIGILSWRTVNNDVDLVW